MIGIVEHLPSRHALDSRTLRTNAILFFNYVHFLHATNTLTYAHVHVHANAQKFYEIKNYIAQCVLENNWRNFSLKWYKHGTESIRTSSVFWCLDLTKHFSSQPKKPESWKCKPSSQSASCCSLELLERFL